jgi:hypothetical protein
MLERTSDMSKQTKGFAPLALGLMLALATAGTASAAGSPAAGASLDSASADVQRVAHWISTSGDNRRMPYLLIDKVNATVYAFDADGHLRGAAPALLGMAKGDRLLTSNDTAVDAIPEDERITPAGRYVSGLGVDSKGEELLIIDYAAAISLHPVVKGTPEEQRAKRLGSPTSADNRISHGCINVPKDFYAGIVSPTFARTRGVVYILPETGSATQLFGIRTGGGATMDAVADQ